MENPKVEIQDDCIVIKGRRLKIIPLLELLSNSDKLSDYSKAIDNIVYSMAQSASFILSCLDLSDKERTAGGEGFPTPETFFDIQLLSQKLRDIEP